MLQFNLKQCLLAGSASLLISPIMFSQALAQTTPAARLPATSAKMVHSAGPAATVGEVIVTAERRSSNIQKTPVAISAVTGDMLLKQQINDLEHLSINIPNLSFSRNGSDSAIYIRGIGLSSIAPGADPRVAIYTDGVYNARDQSALTSLYDIERVEVLAGPQGTLYGRNATAGAINVLSRDPGNELNGYGTLTVGSYGLIQTEGAVGGPLTDTVSGRIAFQTADRNGYGKNIQTDQYVDDEHTRAVRGTLKYDPNSRVDVVLKADYRNEDDHNFGYHFLGNTPGNTLTSEALGFSVPNNPRDMAGQGPQGTIESYGASATVTIDLGGPKLTSVTGYRHLTDNYTMNADLSTSGYLPIYIREASNAYSQEVRIADTIGPVEAIVGGYYFHEGLDEKFAANIAGVLVGIPNTSLFRGRLSGGTEATDAYAAFAQATYHVTGRFGIDFGIRYSTESRHMNEYSAVDFANLVTPNIGTFQIIPSQTTFDSKSATWSATDPKVTLHYQLTDTVFAYATYSVGFKSGGFNVGFLQPAFAPEKLTDYEGGIKADLFDRRLRANLSGFYYDYKNLQVNETQGVQLITTNAAAARLYGVEGQFTAVPTPDLRLGFNFAWLNATYVNYREVDQLSGVPKQLAGNQLPLAPKWKIDAEIAYTFHSNIGDFTPRADVAWVSKVYFNEFNYPFMSQPAHAVGDLYLDYDPLKGGWLASAYVKNVANDYYIVSQTVGSNFLGFYKGGQVGAPRTFGVAITKRF